MAARSLLKLMGQRTSRHVRYSAAPPADEELFIDVPPTDEDVSPSTCRDNAVPLTKAVCVPGAVVIARNCASSATITRSIEKRMRVFSLLETQTRTRLMVGRGGVLLLEALGGGGADDGRWREGWAMAEAR